MNQAGRYSSPLRYPGGKAKVANFVKLLLLKNGLVGRDYVEPYAGGAAVAMSLLFEDYVDRVHINDLNAGVYAFWHSVLQRTQELCELVEEVPVTIDEWHRQRAVLANPAAGLLEVGFATFFLNRTNRSGIIGGGVIGGLDQTGPWKLDARYNKHELTRRIRKIGRHRNRIELTNEDAAEFLVGWADCAVEPAFIYLDPPYFVKGEGLYDNFYNPEDHAAIAAAVGELSQPWMVSYDAHPEIIKLYRDRHHIRYSLAYSAHKDRTQGTEVMFFSKDIQLPDEGPSGISTAAVARAQAACV